jgi:hypothetical protein
MTFLPVSLFKDENLAGFFRQAMIEEITAHGSLQLTEMLLHFPIP